MKHFFVSLGGRRLWGVGQTDHWVKKYLGRTCLYTNLIRRTGIGQKSMLGKLELDELVWGGRS